MPRPPPCTIDSVPCMKCTTCMLQRRGLSKLATARRNKTGVDFTHKEFSTVLQQSIHFGLASAPDTELGMKLSRLFKKFDALSSADPDCRYLTAEETETWCAAFDGLNGCLSRSSIDKHLCTWLSIKQPAGKHPLDGEMDLDIVYGRKVNYVFGATELCFELSVDKIKQKAKDYFFHIMETLRRLEQCKKERKEAALIYQELCAITKVMGETYQNRPESVPAASQSKAQPLRSAGKKLCQAIKAGKGAILTRGEVLQVLRFCEDIKRPEAKTSHKRPDFPSAAKAPSKNSEEPDTLDPTALRTLYLRGPSSDEIGRGFLKPPLKAPEALVHEVRTAKEGGFGYKFNYQTAYDLLFGFRYMFRSGRIAIVDPSVDALHPQATACNKLIVSNSYRENCTFDADEVIYLSKLWEDFLAIRAPLLRDGGSHPASECTSPLAETDQHGTKPPTVSPEDNLKRNRTNIKINRDIFFGGQDWCRSFFTVSQSLENGEDLATILRDVAKSGYSQYLPSNKSIRILAACQMIFRYGSIALVDPKSDPLHHQVTAIDKLIFAYSLRQQSNAPQEVHLTKEEILCLSQIFDQMPAIRAKCDQADGSAKIQQVYGHEELSGLIEELYRQVQPPSSEPQYSSKLPPPEAKEGDGAPIMDASEATLALPAPKEAMDHAKKITVEEFLNAPDMLAHQQTPPQPSASSLTNEVLNNFKSDATTNSKASRKPSDASLTSQGSTTVDPKTLPKYSEIDMGVIYEALVDAADDHAHGVTVRDYIPKGKNAAGATLMVIKLICSRMRLSEDHYKEKVERLKQIYEAELEELRQQKLDDKTRAETKYNTLREDHGNLKENAARQSTQAEADIKALKTKIEDRDTKIKELKEDGKTQIQESRDRVKIYKQKYDDEVSSNVIQKLDFEAMGQMVEELKAEKEVLAKESTSGKSMIIELKKEIGGLRAKQASIAYDERKVAEWDTLKQQNCALNKERSLLTLENKTFKSEARTLKTALAAMESIQESTKAELDKARTKLRSSRFGYSEQVEAVQDELARGQQKLAQLANDLDKAEGKIVFWFDQYAAQERLIKTQKVELDAEKAKNVALQMKLGRIVAVATS